MIILRDRDQGSSSIWPPKPGPEQKEKLEGKFLLFLIRTHISWPGLWPNPRPYPGAWLDCCVRGQDLGSAVSLSLARISLICRLIEAAGLWPD